ncbi:hypothetical protein GCM10011608_49460 [Micromonospora sonchi]|uniref:Uncharacterized protein n=1 Tax=Micromonospora sonchi TaxID=1763543 RepID=A0A917U6A7_9ACTN|nr:hypothetical protein [Micromonospora sonchi]GGM58561.1 hypothetical protein GCM10011608_49460 [Micromonospora sonchi]
MSITGEKSPAVSAMIRRVRVPMLLIVIAVVIAGLGGYRVGLSRDRHSAIAVVLTGTVTWSNEETRLIAFETDGVVREANDGDTIYSVLGNGWEDAEGTIHVDGTYPTCLAGKGDDPVSTHHRRVELTVIDWDTGGAPWMHVAVQVRCLD